MWELKFMTESVLGDVRYGPMCFDGDLVPRNETIDSNQREEGKTVPSNLLALLF